MIYQTAQKVLMISPTRFGFNEEAFLTNSFQNRPNSTVEVQRLAKFEFDQFVHTLERVGIEVHVFHDVANSKTPDSIFPNNWFSTHQDGKLITYPMAVANRRQERRADILESIIEQGQYQHIDLTESERLSEPHYLEGTGSVIFDHRQGVIYAALSPRTHQSVVEKLASILHYSACTFTAYGKSQEPIYHTNVMLCIGERFIVAGMNTIDQKDRERVRLSFEQSGKELIELSNEQIYTHFAGNMLQLRNDRNEAVLVLSKSAYDSLSARQLEQLARHNEHFAIAEIPTIEKIGGGSARCMLAELF